MHCLQFFIRASLPSLLPLLACAACCYLLWLAGGLLWLQEAEGLVGELGEVVRQQKLRMRGLAQERAEACARLQAMNPQVCPYWWLLLLCSCWCWCSSQRPVPAAWCCCQLRSIAAACWRLPAAWWHPGMHACMHTGIQTNTMVVYMLLMFLPDSFFLAGA